MFDNASVICYSLFGKTKGANKIDVTLSKTIMIETECI